MKPSTTLTHCQCCDGLKYEWRMDWSHGLTNAIDAAVFWFCRSSRRRSSRDLLIREGPWPTSPDDHPESIALIPVPKVKVLSSIVKFLCWSCCIVDSAVNSPHPVDSAGYTRIGKEPSLMNTSSVEHVDVLIVGAGNLPASAPPLLPPEIANRTRRLRSWSARAAGGTWDLFRYPGIRSDPIFIRSATSSSRGRTTRPSPAPARSWTTCAKP